MKKRKFFSFMLMGLLTLGATSMVTSCKDYDDDINNLQDEQAQLTSQINALQSTLTSVQSSAQSAASTAQEALTAAQTAAANANTAIQNATNAQAAATAAQSAADAVRASLANYVTNDALTSQLTNYATSEALSQGLANLQTQVNNAATKDELTALQTKVNNYDAAINALYTAVTSVELFGTYTGNGAIWKSDDNAGLSTGKSVALDMMHGLVGETSTFGDNEAYSANDIVTASPQQTFTKGDDIYTSTGVIVRVNPVNANLSTAKIVLVNSQGEVLDAVETGTPTQYEGLITSRATNIGSGLWSIPVHVAKGYTKADFEKAVTDAESGKAILYAVAINNTTDATQGENRYVASTYDVAASYNDYEPAYSFDFKVDNTFSSDIHNRWDGSKAISETGEEGSYKELKWKKAPATAAVTSGNKQNTQDAGSTTLDDARSTVALYPVTVGKAFTVKIADAENADSTWANRIKYYYVTFDKNNAIESVPSEWNAWNSYASQITGLNAVTSADAGLDITINATAADGDVIGFRVYAVNYDGTLADPDGRAFYVQVGKAANTDNVSANDTITSVAAAGLTDNWSTEYATNLVNDTVSNVVIIPLNTTFKSNTTSLGGDATALLTTTTASNLLNNEKVYYQLLDKDGKAAANWDKATQIAVGLRNGGNWKDDTDLTFTVKATSTTNSGSAQVTRTDNTLTVTVHKVLPNSTNVRLSFRPEQNINATDFYLYMVPGEEANPNDNNVWKVPTTTGSNIEAISGLTNAYRYTQGAIDLDNTFYNLPTNIVFTFANAKDGSNNSTVSNTTNEDKVLTEARKYITAPDAQDWHNVTASINYGKISTEKKSNGAVVDYTVDVQQTLRAKFVCWESANTYAWGTHTEGSGEDAKTVSNKLSITYKATGNYSEIDLTTGNNSIAVTNTYDPARFSGTLGSLVGTSGYLVVGASHFEYTGADGVLQTDPYLTPSVSNDGKLTITRSQGQNTVGADHDENLVIEVRDAYGHTSKITVPVTIKKPTEAESTSTETGA